MTGYQLESRLVDIHVFVISLKNHDNMRRHLMSFDWTLDEEFVTRVGGC